jgi:hypothetical protein
MLRLLVDTSVWLELAKLRDGQRLIVPVRVLVSQGKLELLVPSLILEEFARNRPRAEASVTASVHERFRLLRNDLREYGGHERDQWMEEMTHRVPLVSAMTLQNFRCPPRSNSSISRTEPSEADRLRVIQRALDKRAPFHRNKNSVADGLLIELYCSAVNGSDLTRDEYGFVTRKL